MPMSRKKLYLQENKNHNRKVPQVVHSVLEIKLRWCVPFAFRVRSLN